MLVQPRRPTEVLRRPLSVRRLQTPPRRWPDPGRGAKGQPRKPITVYSCDGCGARAVGDQRCEECQIFMRRIGIGGTCPSCEEPISVNELLGEEVIV